MRMASRYGHAWVSQYGPLPDGIAAAEWRGTLAGLSAAQLREGFEADAVRGSDWPPSSARFRALCLGIPMIASVRAEIDAQIRQSRHAPIVNMCRFSRGVWSRMDIYGYRNAAMKGAERIFNEAYERTREFVMEGGTLPVEPAALIEKEKPEFKPASPEVVAAHLAKLSAILRVEPEGGAAV